MAEKGGTFELGLAMAGAISAGAYSGGVLDFLFQALEEWERAKSANPDSVPGHNVCIKVVTGASAGSITGALAPAALACGARPVALPPVPGAAQPQQPHMCTLPALYTAWVKRPDMALPSGNDLLGTGDLGAGGPVVSLLNASVLDGIGNEALRASPPPQPPLFGPACGGRPYPYVAEKLHLYMTVSNVRGVPYTIRFKSGLSLHGHGMLSHGDRAHYVISGVGAAARPSAWAGPDPGIAVDASKLPPAAPGNPPLPAPWSGYLQAALASSAFPVGLSPRRIDSDTDAYENRQWPFPRDPGHAIEPDWPEPWKTPGKDRPYDFVNVDGGLINNEPFEYAHFALMADPNVPNPRPGDEADRAVILVDPFPENPYFETDDKKLSRALVAVAKAIFPVLKDQARFKPNELALAWDDDIYSRFLIAPRRAGPDGKPMKFAIATGLLGGFGGFLDESLRAFDYQLGRRNCQRFLMNELALPEGNPMVKGRAGEWPGWSQAARDKFKFKDRDDPADQADYYPIVPLVGSAALEVPLPPWPKISAARLATIEDRIVARAKVLVPRLLEDQVANRFLRWGAKTLWHLMGVDTIKDYVHLAVQQDLIKRDQHADWSLASDDERAIFAALSDPAYDYRTVAGIAGAANVAPAAVTAALKRYPDRVYVASGKGPDGADAYTLDSRKPDLYDKYLKSLYQKPVIG